MVNISSIAVEKGKVEQMQWCVTLYEECKLIGKSLRFGRTLVVLGVFMMLVTAELSMGHVYPEIRPEKNETETAAEETTPIVSEVPAEKAEMITDGADEETAAIKDNPVMGVPAITDLSVTEMSVAAEEPVPAEPALSLPVITPAPSEDRPMAPSDNVSAEEAPMETEPFVPEDTTEITPSVPAEPEEIIPDVPSAPEETFPSDEESVAGPVAVDGFLINAAGMIYGVTDGLDVYDGCLRLPSEGCKGILAGAFRAAPAGICEMYIPANITYIEEGAFLGLTEMEWFESAGSGGYVTRDGVLFSNGSTCILSFPAARTGSYKVPAGVTRFAAGAFAGSRLDTLDAVDCLVVDTGDLPATIRLL